MQQKDRRRVFRRRYQALNILGLLLFIGMIAQSWLMGIDPSPRWQLPAGCLIIAIGVHLIVYKEEASEMFQEQYDSFWGTNPVFAFFYDPVLVAGMGALSFFIGVVFLVKGILG